MNYKTRWNTLFPIRPGTIAAGLLVSIFIAGCGSDEPAPPISTNVDASSAPAASGSNDGSSKAVVVTVETNRPETSTPGTTMEFIVPEDEQTDAPPQQPGSHEIAATIELESQLNEIVSAATNLLDPVQSERLLSRTDKLMQDGFGCSEGPHQEACRQLNIRELINEIDNRMRGPGTEY